MSDLLLMGFRFRGARYAISGSGRGVPDQWWAIESLTGSSYYEERRWGRHKHGIQHGSVPMEVRRLARRLANQPEREDEDARDSAE